MPDLLIRDVSEGVVAALDLRASQLGLSRSEYLRRQLSQDAQRSMAPTEVSDLARLAELAQDLTDPEVMARAWS